MERKQNMEELLTKWTSPILWADKAVEHFSESDSSAENMAETKCLRTGVAFNRSTDTSGKK